MKTRIAELRKSLELTQDEFAKRLNLSRNYIWMIENGERIPPERTISAICREFGVREEWLRTGELPVRQAMSRQAEIIKFVGDSMKDAKKTDTQRILTALMDATPEEIEAIVTFARRIAAQYENEKDRL